MINISQNLWNKWTYNSPKRDSIGFNMNEMVHIGHDKLVGEVVTITSKITTIQCFEDTVGLKPGDEVVIPGEAISVTLGPGIISSIFDGIQRPLDKIALQQGTYIDKGINVTSLDTEKLWM